MKMSKPILSEIFSAPLFFIVIMVIFIYFFYQKNEMTSPIIETKKSEMKKIPADVQKVLNEQSKEASISSIFRVPILMYHYVEVVKDEKDTIRKSLNIPLSTFEQQVKTLVDANYTFITAKELGEVFNKKSLMPHNPILLTFDDGHWDLDTDVLPILKKYHAKATVYIISDFIDGSDFLSSKQLQDIISSGLIDVGAHTQHHVSLKDKSLKIVESEIKNSKEFLEKTYHINVVSFAYPNGAFDEQAIESVKKAGFTTAVSTISGVEQGQQNRFFLSRLRPGARTGEILLKYLQQNIFKMY
jgi:peptidoglycan/xylan/chitin deacetylase (PgdA/CDA1 family)